MASVLQLGRYGDICNILPALYLESRKGRRHTLVVSDKFADIIDGISYCDIKRYSQDHEHLVHAIEVCSGLPDLRVAQVHRNPDTSRHESSYAMESYRLAGLKYLWKKAPLIFDRRDSEREQQLLNQIFPKVYDIQPFIAVATKGVSSPFSNSEQLIHGLQSRFPDYKIVDLSSIRAEKIYDLLGVLDAASCLVTIDTAILWLANAAKCPTVTLVSDSFNGWGASPPPCTGIASFKYKEFQIDQVCDAVQSCLLPCGETWGIVDRFGGEDRHKRAALSQEESFDHLLSTKNINRTALDIGDNRPLPMLKNMLEKALMFSSSNDIIIWTNDDVEILDLDEIKMHVMRFGAVGIRRDPAHMGRELFAFRWDWLANRIYHFPDCAVAAPWFDLAVAAWIRKQFGIVSTMDNLSEDFYPCEIPNDSVFIHPDHPSSWVGEKESYPAANWNRRIYRELVK
jgi:hypothetical protein